MKSISIGLMVKLVTHKRRYFLGTVFLTLRGVQRVRVFENWVMRETSGSKGDEQQGQWRNVTRSITVCTIPKIFWGGSNKK
jgi:hypothetical protein